MPMDRTSKEIVLTSSMANEQGHELPNERKSHQKLIQLFKWNKHKKIFLLWIFLFICWLIIAGPLSLQLSYALPRIKTRNIALDKFSEERARDYLNNLTQYKSRVSYQRGNFQARKYLITQIKRIFSRNKRFLRLELDLQNSSDIDGYQLQNILVRISNPITTSKNVSTLLLNAHYDSVEFSPGACDDGSGVVILLELLSNLINDLKITFSNVHLIVVFTDAEEMGLLGVQEFINKHPWRFHVHRFINVDSTSCKERAELTRIGSSELITDYGQVSRPRANVIFREIMYWFRVQTEYTIYNDIGSVMGYDFASIIDGYTYHTVFDNPSNIKRGILQDLGDNLGILIRQIFINGIQKIESPIDNDPLIYFDVFGRYLFIYRMSTSIILQEILITSMIVISLILIIVDEIYHQRRSSPCSDHHCIYFHFRKTFLLRLISILLYFISNVLSIIIGLFFSLIIAEIITLIRPVSWFGSSTLAIFLFSFPCLISFITNAYLWDLFHRFILKKYPKTSLENNSIDHLNDIKFNFEQNISIVFVYGLLMMICIYSKESMLYLILFWSIFICSSYLLLIIIDFILHWKEIQWNFFKQRYHWLFLPLIICLLPSAHTIEIINRLLRFLIPFMSNRFGIPSWAFYRNIVLCSIIAIPTVFFSLIFLPILQRTKCFGRTLIVLLIVFSIILTIAYNRQPFTNMHPSIFYAEHTSESIFNMERSSYFNSNVSLQSQSSSIRFTVYNGVNVLPVLVDFSKRSGFILHNMQCLHPKICTFDDTFNRTIAVQNIKIESVKNLTNYTIRIRHVLSYYIQVSSNSSIKFNVRQKWILPRTETIIDVTLDSILSSFNIDINIKRCDLADSPFLILFMRFIKNMVPIGTGKCQAINDKTTLVIKQLKPIN